MAAKVSASKAPARRKPATPAPAPVADEFEVPHLSTEESGDEERVPLFYIDDREYSVVKRPGVNIGLQYLHLTQTKGESAALDYLLGKLLGDEGYAALRGYDKLTQTQFKHICQIASDLTMGSLEAPKE